MNPYHVIKNEHDVTRSLQQHASISKTPRSMESIFYFKHKLSIFNLTVYDLGDTNGFCYMWHEGVASRGLCEIASCVYKYLQHVASQGVKDVLYSDNSGGQNSNKYSVTMLWYAKQMLNFNSIAHKFLVKGHTRNKGDSMHAAIEWASRPLHIYTTPQWAAIMRANRRSKPYIVTEMFRFDFINFKDMSTNLINFKVDNHNESVCELDEFVFSFIGQW